MIERPDLWASYIWPAYILTLGGLAALLGLVLLVQLFLLGVLHDEPLQLVLEVIAGPVRRVEVGRRGRIAGWDGGRGR